MARRFWGVTHAVTHMSSAEQLQSALVVSLVPDTWLKNPFWKIMVIYHIWLVVLTILKNMTSSVGMMTFPIYGKIKFMFQTTNQVWVLGQVATFFDVKIPQWPKMPKVLCTKKCWHSRFLLLKNDWTEQERFNQTKQSYKSKKTCHTMNGLKDPLLLAWLPVEKMMSKQTVVNPRYSPHQIYLIAVWMFVCPWVLLRKHPNLGRLTLVHIHTFYRFILSFVSCWATFFVGCIMLYPIIPIYWPHPKLYLFNSHVCLVNPVGQAHILLIKLHHDCLSTHMFLR